jgi:hypothetical protein
MTETQMSRYEGPGLDRKITRDTPKLKARNPQKRNYTGTSESQLCMQTPNLESRLTKRNMVRHFLIDNAHRVRRCSGYHASDIFKDGIDKWAAFTCISRRKSEVSRLTQKTRKQGKEKWQLQGWLESGILDLCFTRGTQ